MLDLGEFQTTHYDIPKDLAVDQYVVLDKLGFDMVYDGANNQVTLCISNMMLVPYVV